MDKKIREQVDIIEEDIGMLRRRRVYSPEFADGVEEVLRKLLILIPDELNHPEITSKWYDKQINKYKSIYHLGEYNDEDEYLFYQLTGVLDDCQSAIEKVKYTEKVGSKSKTKKKVSSGSSSFFYDSKIEVKGVEIGGGVAGVVLLLISFVIGTLFGFFLSKLI